MGRVGVKNLEEDREAEEMWKAIREEKERNNER